MKRFARLTVTGPRHRTAEVALVRDTAGERNQLAVVEERRHDRGVDRVRHAGEVGVVGDIGIARADVGTERRDHRLHDLGQRSGCSDATAYRPTTSPLASINRQPASCVSRMIVE